MSKAKLLIVDDTPENIDLLVSILAGAELDILAANSGERALELVPRTQPDLVLLDVMMPGIDGFETCRRLRTLPGGQDLPVIFVTARAEDTSQGFAAGGVDYIAKPVRADEVRARVHHHLEKRRLLRDLQQLNAQLEARVRERTQELVQANRQLREEINERRFMQDRLSYLATHDFVTRLYNRDALETHVQGLLGQASRVDDSACIVLVELARFSIVNDACGYIAGDELLRQVADLLAALAASDDFISRLGGDRFAIICSRSTDTVLALGQRIKRAFEGFVFYWDGRPYSVDARVAVVPIGTEYYSFEQVMAKADEASYLARREGGPGVRLHQPSPREADPRESVNWAYRLLDALKSDHFRVFFQRIVPLQDELPTGLRFETLIRLWDPEQQRVISPAVFIGPAERYQIIDQVDRWMLRAVLGQLAALPAELLQRIELVSINLSAYSLRDAGLADFILGLLADHPCAPSKLCFEITETEAIVNLEVAQTFMHRLKAAGLRFSLDDFGTGFASFAYLKRLPFDSLKLDGAFVRDMDHDEANATMVRSMVQMAQALGLPVVAEFVESARIAAALRDLGVQYAQGYHFHQPEGLSEAALRAAP